MSDVVIVAGGANGLGCAISERLAAQGKRVVVADIDAEAARAVAEAVDGVAVGVDITRAEQVRAMADAASAQGAIKGLVLSAAVEPQGSALETSDDVWQQALDINAKGAFLCMKAVLPTMAAAGGGSVVALSSVLGQIGRPGFAAYSASKAVLVNLCKQAAIEYAGHNVRVNVLSPSATRCGAFLRMAEGSNDPQAIFDMVAANVPMGRVGEAGDICDAVDFLLGDKSRYISGTVLPVDGGMAARRRN